VSRKQKL